MKRVHVVIDEAAALEKFDPIVDGVTQLRGHGVRMTLAFQSPSQLRSCFGEGVDQTILANTAHIHFGVDAATAEQLSKRLGEETVVKESGGSSWGSSTSWSSGPQQSQSSGGNSGSTENWDPTHRRLLTADEVENLDSRVAISFMPGSRPIFTRLVPYWEAPWLGQRPGALLRSAQALMIAICSAAMLAVMLTIALHLTSMLELDGKRSAAKPARRVPQVRYR
jgi:type IV secretion system protein VirD4